jgi:hypothetical protein
MPICFHQLKGGSMKLFGFCLAAALVSATAVQAQEPAALRPEIRPFVGAYIPAGALRNDFKAATMLGAQAALEVSDYVHFLGTVAWTHGHNKFAGFSKDLTYIWQYDVGVELNLIQEVGSSWWFRPFVGVGGGGRTYDYRAEEVGTRTCTAGYAALGTEMQRRNIAFRLEGRDYLTCFESPMTAKKTTRNDFGLAFGLAYHIR